MSLVSYTKINKETATYTKRDKRDIGWLVEGWLINGWLLDLWGKVSKQISNWNEMKKE